MSDAPERLKVFEHVNGKLTAEDIAKRTNRHINNIHRDLSMLSDAGLIQQRIQEGSAVKKNNFVLYEKVPLAKTIPLHYFSTPARLPSSPAGELAVSSRGAKKHRNARKPAALRTPTETEILDIAKNGENQLIEFKGQGTEARKITREIAAMLNTREGGIILYGIDDDGNIEGTDVPPQKLDQPLQNSIRNSISPAATVRLHLVTVLGSEVIVIIVPPWNRRDVYQFDEKVLIRKGTNVFAAKPEELRRLYARQYVI